MRILHTEYKNIWHRAPSVSWVPIAELFPDFFSLHPLIICAPTSVLRVYVSIFTKKPIPILEMEMIHCALCTDMILAYRIPKPVQHTSRTKFFKNENSSDIGIQETKHSSTHERNKVFQKWKTVLILAYRIQKTVLHTSGTKFLKNENSSDIGVQDTKTSSTHKRNKVFQKWKQFWYWRTGYQN
jgi:hypothetical protein